MPKQNYIGRNPSPQNVSDSSSAQSTRALPNPELPLQLLRPGSPALMNLGFGSSVLLGGSLPLSAFQMGVHYLNLNSEVTPPLEKAPRCIFYTAGYHCENCLVHYRLDLESKTDLAFAERVQNPEANGCRSGVAPTS